MKRKIGHYCNCHKRFDRDNSCRCSICEKFLGIYGELYKVEYDRTNPYNQK